MEALPKYSVSQDATFKVLQVLHQQNLPWACGVQQTKLLGHTIEAVTTTPHTGGNTLALTTMMNRLRELKQSHATVMKYGNTKFLLSLPILL